MLMPAADRQSVIRLAVEVPPPPLWYVLTELLRQWDYQVVPAAEEIPLLTIAGSAVEPSAPAMLRLTAGGGEESFRIPLPFPVAGLWLALERHFHAPPRQHLRIPLELPVIIQVRHRAEPSLLVSLSDQGGRFRYPQELAPGEEAVVCVQAGGENILLEGKVIYTIDRLEIGGEGYESGIVFDRLPPGRRRWLHERLVCACLQRVRARLPEEIFREGIAWLEFPAELLTSKDDFCLA